MGTPGVDNVTGAGELQLPKAPESFRRLSRAREQGSRGQDGQASLGHRGRRGRGQPRRAGEAKRQGRQDDPAGGLGRRDVSEDVATPWRRPPSQRERSSTAPSPSTRRETGAPRAARRSSCDETSARPRYRRITAFRRNVEARRRMELGAGGVRRPRVASEQLSLREIELYLAAVARYRQLDCEPTWRSDGRRA